MDILHSCVDFFLHLDHHMTAVVANYGPWAYGLLFAILFAETGFVVTPFLPGDSLLFVLGALAAQGSLNLGITLGLMAAAAILGNMANYTIGRFLANRVLSPQGLPFVKKAHIDRTHEFYAKYGAKTIIITRFVPIIRTFAHF